MLRGVRVWLTWPLDIITLGMFIVDEFEYNHPNGEPNVEKQQNGESQIGGGGTYAIMGSRMWTSPTRLGQIIDTGRDFDESTRKILESYEHDETNRMFILRQDPSKPTTRALNKYMGQRREFKYLTERHKLHLKDYIALGVDEAKYLHSVCNPERQTAIIKEVKELGWRNVTYIYEPLPEAMTATNMDHLIETMKIDRENTLLSPNHTEAAAMLGVDEPTSSKACEELTQAIHDYVNASKVVLRCGKLGTYVSTPDEAFWVEALHIHNQEKVLDVTGAGNAFLGGLAGGLNRYGDIRKAAACGTISAGYTIEKDGLPCVSLVDEQECWNGRTHTAEQELDHFIKTRM